jgi:hypothetical protein
MRLPLKTANGCRSRAIARHEAMVAGKNVDNVNFRDFIFAKTLRSDALAAVYARRLSTPEALG